MKISLSLWIGLLCCLNLGEARDDAPGYSQSYSILIKGTIAGHETVTEKMGDAGKIISASEHEIFLTDGLGTKRMAFSTQMILSKGGKDPISYNFRYIAGSSDSYEVVIQNAQITRTLMRGGGTSQATVPFLPGMVILDFSVYHQYDYLVRKYDVRKGGRQLFADFVPVIGNDIPVSLTLVGNEKLELKKGTLLVRNFRIEFVGIWAGSLSVDQDNRLVSLVIPAQDLQVVRSDLLDSADK
jgi:hypothetical protein